jgi:gliding motility-associated-like protein
MTLKATGGSPGNYRWYDADQNIIADENDAELLTADLNASRRFFVSVVEDGCESPLTEVQAIIRAVPAAPDVATAENCGPASLTLEALDATNGYYRWYDAERNQIEGENEATFTTPEISKSTTYYVSIVEDGCEGDLAEVPAAIKPVPDAPAAEGDLICGEGTTTLTAEGADDGNFRWYDAEQTLIKGATSAAFTTPLIDESTRFYVSILQDGCESNKTEVLAEVRKEVTPPEANDAFVCGQGSAGLQASGATNGNYRWYDADQNLIPGEQNAVFNTPVLTEDAVFYVSQIAGKCESELTAVEVSIREVPDAPGLTATSSCGAAALQLKATGAEDGAYRWYDHDQNLLPKETSATLATETLQQSSTFYASIVREGCESEKTPVEATINTPPPAPRVSSVERCGRGTFTLQAQDEQGMTYQWYRSDGVTPIRGADGAAYTTARLSNSRAFYVSSFRNGCESEKTEVMARVLPVPTVPGVQEAHFCKPGEKNLQITDAKANMRYRWYASEQAEEALAESNGTFSALIGSDTTFYVSSTNGACESERTIFSVTLEELPAFEAGEDIYLLPGESAVLQPDAGFTDYRWYPARGLDFPDRQEPQASPQRTTTYRVEALTAGGCLISDEITVHVTHQFPVPTAFTPNGDGLNDTWKIPLAYKYPDMQVKIYNRWGELVFESVGYEQAWDGRMMDGKTIEGTYLYHIVLDGESPPRQGKVTVVR